MFINLKNLFPKLSNTYYGPRTMYLILILLTIVNTVRSFIHMFSSDGGAESIAGINVGVDGGTNIVAIFGQWGASQLVLAIICWVIIIKYKSLVPFAYLILFVEQLLRIISGNIHSVVSNHTPPGAIMTNLITPFLAVAIIVSLIQIKKNNQKI